MPMGLLCIKAGKCYATKAGEIRKVLSVAKGRVIFDARGPHLHGHHLQVVGIGGRRFAGPMRDTVIVPSHNPVTIAFDAALKGDWFLHCHHLYHMATGMMTELRVA